MIVQKFHILLTCLEVKDEILTYQGILIIIDDVMSIIINVSHILYIQCFYFTHFDEIYLEFLLKLLGHQPYTTKFQRQTGFVCVFKTGTPNYLGSNPNQPKG